MNFYTLMDWLDTHTDCWQFYAIGLAAGLVIVSLVSWTMHEK